MTTTQTRRKRFGEVQVGDGIRTVPADPSNGRLWSGVVTEVSQPRLIPGHGVFVSFKVRVDGRSLCAEDLTYGFSNKRDIETGEIVHHEVVYEINRRVDEATFRKVINRGRKRWDGMVITPPVS